MKNILTVLIFCSLIISGGLQAPCAALEETIPNDVIVEAKNKCLTIYPDLKTKLDSWETNYKEVFYIKDKEGTIAYYMNIKTPDESVRKLCYEKVRKLHDHWQEMDNLQPQIKQLSSEFFGVLADLETKYPHIKTPMHELVGVKEETHSIHAISISFLAYCNNIDLFTIDVSKIDSLKSLLTAKES